MHCIFKGPFVVALCTEFGTEGLPDESRQLAGLYLKNLLSANVSGKFLFVDSNYEIH